MIDHRGLVGVLDCICSKCKNPIPIGQEYHRIKNEIYCAKCDPVKTHS